MKNKKLWGFMFAGAMALSILCTSLTAFSEEAVTGTENEATTESETSEETITTDDFQWLPSMVVTFTDGNNPEVSYEIYCDDTENIMLRKVIDGETNSVEINLCTQGIPDSFDEQALNFFSSIEYYFSTIPQMMEIQGIW
ncbi:MAG: hypothetical protein LIO99_02565 [Clostridiales bacterium]|nr:hypothetical protein [Clostridiales bacterium]